MPENIYHTDSCLILNLFLATSKREDSCKQKNMYFHKKPRIFLEKLSARMTYFQWCILVVLNQGRGIFKYTIKLIGIILYNCLGTTQRICAD